MKICELTLAFVNGGIVHSGLVIDINKHECFLDDKPLPLTPTEFSILRALCEKRLVPLNEGGFNVFVDARAASVLQKLSYELNCNEQIVASSGFRSNKEDITGIAHEPWHFRYIGAPHSRIMREMDIVLEEYISLLKEFSHGKRPLQYDFDGSPIEISYLAAEKGATFFEVEDNLPYSVSGDNIGGFIITIWKN